MADVTTSSLLDRLRTLTRDTSDKTFSLAEKEEALAQAIGDEPFSYKVVRDDSTTTVKGQNVYDLPDNWEQLFSLSIDAHDDGFPIEVSPTGYEVIDGQIWISRNHSTLPDKHKLIMLGKQKLTSSDTSVPSYLAGFVLHTAAAYLWELLMSDKTARFLTNDTTLQEIMATINNHRAVAARYQKTLPHQNYLVL